ncbi:N-acetyltransferase [Pluralibacter sp.]|uniref:GNAT family N-acetyltransferase n=1 Tax=Pluralibacter sp. TaxID=1920032 RepID=UPI0025F46D04|nr:GNAT family N-acetyltransferase [Pluralibacter sp.]MBV8045061.1 GNAT family N-acetyltransferase [Pluralibacter sp.]
MQFIAVPATHFSGEQLTSVLGDCFTDYIVPFAPVVDVFVQRFTAEGMSLVDSCIWLESDTPAAIAIVARRGHDARLAAFAVHPRHRGKGVGKRMMSALLASLREKGVRQMWLEVIRQNPAGVALYQSLGFEVRRGLCGYVSAPQFVPEGILQETDVLALVRRAAAEIDGSLPWVLDPFSLCTLPCQAWTLGHQAYAVISRITAKPQLQLLWVEPRARGRGLAREMLRALGQQFPALGTSAAVPESFTPLFHGAGYTTMAIQQYEMRITLRGSPP